MDNKYCKDMNITTVKNFVDYTDSNETKRLSFHANILFCNETIDNEKPYIAYFNQALMQLIVLKSYHRNEVKNYIKLFESLEYKVNKKNLPLNIQNNI